MEYIICFCEACKCYNSDFATADPGEKEFAMCMAEKLASVAPDPFFDPE